MTRCDDTSGLWHAPTLANALVQYVMCAPVRHDWRADCRTAGRKCATCGLVRLHSMELCIAAGASSLGGRCYVARRRGHAAAAWGGDRAEATALDKGSRARLRLPQYGQAPRSMPLSVRMMSRHWASRRRVFSTRTCTSGITPLSLDARGSTVNNSRASSRRVVACDDDIKPKCRILT